MTRHCHYSRCMCGSEKRRSFLRRTRWVHSSRRRMPASAITAVAMTRSFRFHSDIARTISMAAREDSHEQTEELHRRDAEMRAACPYRGHAGTGAEVRARQAQQGEAPL